MVIGEENDVLRNDLCDLLSRLPVNVISVASGSELVVLLTDPHAVDLLITDVRLPWMSGIHVAITARKSGLDMPIILMSVNPSIELHQKVRRLCKAVLVDLSMPPDNLLEIVRVHLFVPIVPESPPNNPSSLPMNTMPVVH